MSAPMPHRPGMRRRIGSIVRVRVVETDERMTLDDFRAAHPHLSDAQRQELSRSVVLLNESFSFEDTQGRTLTVRAVA